MAHLHCSGGIDRGDKESFPQELMFTLRLRDINEMLWEEAWRGTKENQQQGPKAHSRNRLICLSKGNVNMVTMDGSVK